MMLLSPQVLQVHFARRSGGAFAGLGARGEGSGVRVSSGFRV